MTLGYSHTAVYIVYAHNAKCTWTDGYRESLKPWKRPTNVVQNDGYRENDGYRVPAGYRVQHIYITGKSTDNLKHCSIYLSRYLNHYYLHSFNKQLIMTSLLIGKGIRFILAVMRQLFWTTQLFCNAPTMWTTLTICINVERIKKGLAYLPSLEKSKNAQSCRASCCCCSRPIDHLWVIGSLTSLDACNSGASSDVREPISQHQAVHKANCASVVPMGPVCNTTWHPKINNRQFRKRWRRPQILQFCGDYWRIRRGSRPN